MTFARERDSPKEQENGGDLLGQQLVFEKNEVKIFLFKKGRRNAKIQHYGNHVITYMFTCIRLISPNPQGNIAVISQ